MNLRHAQAGSPGRRDFDNLARHSSHGTREGGYDFAGRDGDDFAGAHPVCAGRGCNAEWRGARRKSRRGQVGTRLFADSCATCHRSAKGLTKGRFRLTLYFFLQQHYASNSSSAWELSSYLESVDAGARPKSHGAGPKRSPVRVGTGVAVGRVVGVPAGEAAAVGEAGATVAVGWG